jgi:hypothetical protein
MVIPRDAANGSIRDTSGNPIPRSHFETAALDTPIHLLKPAACNLFFPDSSNQAACFLSVQYFHLLSEFIISRETPYSRNAPLKC